MKAVYPTNYLSEGEQKILTWLSLRDERGFCGPQRYISGGIGYSRPWTNILLQELAKKKLVYIYRSRIDKKITLVTLDPIKAIEDKKNG